MKVEWHCRGCNNSGNQEISLKELYEQVEKGMNFIEATEACVIHECDKRNIGVKSGSTVEAKR